MVAAMETYYLPFPPSVNHYWRKWNNRMVISAKGREYRRDICGLLAPAGGGARPPHDGRLALCMDAFPPDRRRRDLDNLLKGPQDSLAHAGVYQDDSQIDCLLVRRRETCPPNGKIIVRIGPLPLRHCPLCGSMMPEDLWN